FIDMRRGALRFVRAKAVLMATGGGPTMYRYHTPSGDKSMDGLAMALRFGLPLRDMEMVQFHPTGLLAGRDTRMTGTVLEEGLRGAGGHLLDGDGRRFLFDYDAHGERATRDVVSRAMYAEMRAGHATPNGGVYLSMAHLRADAVAAQFPGMVKRCADCGFDLVHGRVEVVPTAHYFMGGVVCDADTATEMPGLFVAGEDAGGVHGANRLGGNGVANSTVFGGICGERMARYVAAESSAGGFADDVDAEWVGAEIAAALRPLHARDDSPVARLHELRDELMDIMWRDVGVLRDDHGLRRALGELDALRDETMRLGVASERAFNLSWQDWLNLRNLTDISDVIARAALARCNSRGAHFREDFRDAGDLAKSCFTVSRRCADGVEVTQQPVAFTLVRPGMSLLDESPP
ncbi:MAG: FAD-binding protein, partial [bacterium]